jgi:WD40 repeat protein
MEEDLCFSQIFNVIYDKSGKLIVSADEEGLIKIWNAETGLLLWSLKGTSVELFRPCLIYVETFNNCIEQIPCQLWQ